MQFLNHDYHNPEKIYIENTQFSFHEQHTYFQNHNVINDDNGTKIYFRRG